LGGNLAEAEIAVDQAKKDPNQEAWPIYSAPVPLADGELALRQGNYGRAIAVIDTFLTDFRQLGAYIPTALYLQGQALRGLGQNEAARDCFLEARAKAEAMDARRPLWLILFVLSQLEADPIEAERLRQQAQDIVEYIADHTPTPELRASFLNLLQVQAVFEPIVDD
jgi:hypothetical protein